MGKPASCSVFPEKHAFPSVLWHYVLCPMQLASLGRQSVCSPTGLEACLVGKCPWWWHSREESKLSPWWGDSCGLHSQSKRGFEHLSSKLSLSQAGRLRPWSLTTTWEGPKNNPTFTLYSFWCNGFPKVVISKTWWKDRILSIQDSRSFVME